MGWSERYYADICAEAERELRRLSLPLRDALEEFRRAVEIYRDFADRAGELEALLQRLELLLEQYGPR